LTKEGTEAAVKSPLFAREATGLVRDISLFDMFIFNLAANPIGLALVFILGFQIGLFPGSDPVLAMIVVGIIALFIAATYAQLSSVFPRSGGDYVFNSRILHPALGFGFNFSLSFWEWLTASLSLSFITTLGFSPVLVMAGYLTGNNSYLNLGLALSTTTNVFIIGTVFNIVISLFFLIGTKRTLRFLDVFYVASFIGFVLIIIALATSSPTFFQTNLNNFLHTTGSNLTYSSLISLAQTNGLSIPSGYSIYLLPAMMGVVSIEAIWYFWSTYVGGEVKRGNSVRRQSTAMIGAGIFNGILTLIAIILFFNVVGKALLTSFSYLAFFAPGSIPFAPAATFSGDQVVIFASLATNNNITAILIPILFIGWTVVVVIDFAMQPVRSLFAWAMDRLIPLKFASVSERFHTPIYPVIIGAVVMEIGLIAQVVIPAAVFLIFTASIIAPAFSTMFLTGLSGIVFPFRKKEIFNNSPIAKLKIGGLPLVTITGAVTAAYLIFLVWVFFSYANFFLNTPLLEFLTFGFILIGVILYVIIRAYRKSQGINIDQIFSEIPPE
jgi:amino acid transporter